MTERVISVCVKRIAYEAECINSYELVPLDGTELEPFTAGSHIDLHLPDRMIRSYSLLNDQRERHRYVIAVNKDAASRGGSSFIHDRIRVGDILTVSAPRNNFPLCEDADASVLIAGGIGITPLLSMIRRLEVLERPWRLFYATRTRDTAAFLGELGSLRPNVDLNLHVDIDAERSGRIFDVAAIVKRAPAQAHLYCCGPAPMLEAFEAAAVDRPDDRVHVEYFQARQAPALKGGFEVTLARSNKTVAIEPGQTILETLLAIGITPNYACSEGVCGTCETRVLDGVPDHRDQFLSDDERASNQTIMICCSGSRSRTLVLDI